MRPDIAMIRAAAARLQPYAVHTPLLRSDGLDAALGARIFVKPENLQRGGAFKFRGAMARLTALDAEERLRGVVAYSSGNHALAVASAAAILGLEAAIVMPADAPAAKIAGVRAAGARLTLYDRLRESREAIAARIAAESGAVLVPPFEDPFVIAGQATAGLEAAADLAALGETAEDLIAPVSGGGLMAGLALAFGEASPATRLWAAEPEGHADWRDSLKAGAPVDNAPGIRTICDGLMVPRPGELPWSILQNRLAGGLSVDDETVMAAMRLAFDSLKLVLEPSGAAALGVLMRSRARFAGRCVLVILSGGNVDAPAFARILAGSMG